MKTLVIEAQPDDEGRTLQALIHDRGGFSHDAARGLIDAGAVRLAGPARPAAAGRDAGAIEPGAYARRVAAGERFEIRHDPGTRYKPRARPRSGRGYRVLYQDRDLLVIEKHPAVLSVPTPLRDEDSLIERLVDAERRRGVRRPTLFAVHRLDRDTSGLMLFARTRPAFERLQEQFAARTIERLYTAVACGRVAADSGRIASRLVEDPVNLKMRSARRPGEGKEAITEYTVKARLPGATVLEARLHTGRKNQIRVHFAEAGHPLVGDRRYGKASALISRTALHAGTLRFLHPAHHRPVEFTSPQPRDLRALIAALGRGERP